MDSNSFKYIEINKHSIRMFRLPVCLFVFFFSLVKYASVVCDAMMSGNIYFNSTFELFAHN